MSNDEEVKMRPRTRNTRDELGLLRRISPKGGEGKEAVIADVLGSARKVLETFEDESDCILLIPVPDDELIDVEGIKDVEAFVSYPDSELSAGVYHPARIWPGIQIKVETVERRTVILEADENEDDEGDEDAEDTE